MYINYNNCILLDQPDTQGATIPPSVKEIMVELWGAGSGGTNYCGGTSGGRADQSLAAERETSWPATLPEN